MKKFRFVLIFFLVTILSIVTVGHVLANSFKYYFDFTLPGNGWTQTNDEIKDTTNVIDVYLAVHTHGFGTRSRSYVNGVWYTGAWLTVCATCPNTHYYPTAPGGGWVPHNPTHLQFHNNNLISENHVAGSWIPY